MQLLDNLPSYSKDSFSALEHNTNAPPRTYIPTHTRDERQARPHPPENVSSLIRAIAAGNAMNSQKEQGEERAAKRVRFGHDASGNSSGNNRNSR